MILRAKNSRYPAAILLSLRRKQSYLCSTAHSNSQKNFLSTHYTSSDGQFSGNSLSILTGREHMIVQMEIHQPVCNDFIQKTL